MSILIDINDYVIKNSSAAIKGDKGRVKVRHYLKDPFLKGPIPIPWLLSAVNLGKCALMVGLILWHIDGMRGGRTFRAGRGDIGRLLGVSRLTVLRGIKRLENGGLIFVLREPGRKLVVTLNKGAAASDHR